MDWLGNPASSSSSTLSSPETRALFSVVASIAAYTVLISTIIKDFFPFDLHRYATSKLRNLISRIICPRICVILIKEGDGMANNQLFESAEVYLAATMVSSMQRFQVSKYEKESKYTINVETGEEIADVFEGITYKWKMVAGEDKSHPNFEGRPRVFELSFRSRHRDVALNSYLPHVLKIAEATKLEKRTLRLHTLNDLCSCEMWNWINLDHPATFETMAMDDALKETIMDDLRRFLGRREYYKKVGKAWKRGYLLYGPPGTGKSSLIAAIANFLNFDVYDLEFTSIRSNSALRRLLVGTSNPSILVVEDVDCSAPVYNRDIVKDGSGKLQKHGDQKSEQLTLSGILNFIDGLWSSAGDERIIILTTNHRERLDPALLRAGRMDMHIYMGYCSFSSFKILVSNYLGIHDHPLLEQVMPLIDQVEITPAEVAEILVRNEDPDAAIVSVIECMKMKMEEKEDDRKS
ncbi:HYPER-SENSITIVITY-RELATED 4 protein [Nymphaea thermarum]|nr:HYPER-SENSITIVITY-RELATED 4 protein [Nymphaea thermarum]